MALYAQEDFNDVFYLEGFNWLECKSIYIVFVN